MMDCASPGRFEEMFAVLPLSRAPAAPKPIPWAVGSGAGRHANRRPDASDRTAGATCQTERRRTRLLISEIGEKMERFTFAGAAPAGLVVKDSALRWNPCL